MKHALVESLGQLNTILLNWEKDASIKSIFILGTYKSELYKNFKDFRLNHISKNICGGFYPMVFQGESKSENGVVCIGLEQDFKVQLIKDLHLKETNLAKNIAHLDIGKTTFVLIDAFTPRLEEVVSTVFKEHGLDGNYFGGGCGDLDFVQRPCVFTKDGLFENAVIFGSTVSESTLGIKHGWDV